MFLLLFPFVRNYIVDEAWHALGGLKFNLPVVMVDGMEDEDAFTKPLGRQTIFYYGVGHMLNDITSACWFTYLLVFLTDIGLPPRYILFTCSQFYLVTTHLRCFIL